ncbi:hypothetical protein N9355_04825 [Crocinitomicaceae bacterium]|nr:hypothetical protein [Crocinitomicaceae bacterium]
MKHSLFLTALALFVFTTVSLAQDETKEFDLLSKRIPVTVQAPEDAIVEEGLFNGEVYDEIRTISWELNSGDFSLEVTMDDEPMRQTAEEYMSDWKDLIVVDGDFAGYIVEDENGFISKSISDGEVMYEFYYQLVKGDRLIEFASGMSSDDTSLSAAKRMYEAAKSAK